MAEIDVTRYGDLCRLCGTKTNVVLAVNIFANEGAVRQMDKKIEACLPIKVNETDDLPKMICENCLIKLELFFDFRERSLRTETLLINLCKELNSTKSQNVTYSQLVKLSQSVDHPDLIMVQHPQLMNDQSLQLDLSNLGRENMIVEHEIILGQGNDINPHSLENLDLSHDDLTSQNLSNLAPSNVHQLQEAPYGGDNLQLMNQEHEILTGQYRLSQGLQILDSASSNSDLFKIRPEHSLKPPNERDAIDHNSNNERIKAEVQNNENELGEKDVKNDENDKYVPLYVNDGNNDWFYCNLCGKTVNQKAEFQFHYEQHFNKCTICLAVFTNRDALNAHRKEMHSPEEDKPIRTRLKRATVPMKEELKDIKEDSNSDSEGGNDPDHIEDEEDEDDPEIELTDSGNPRRKKWSPKVCKECGKTYKTNYKLTEHMRKHTGEKPYKCSSCEKAFRSKIGLAQHEAKHTGQYDYACPTCGKGFQCKSYLMVHQRVHSDVKPYPCTTCGRNFKTKQSLLDHTNRHLGVKPYMCDTCGRGFITKGLCRAHQKIHTGLDNRKYSCKVCNKMFVSKSYLQTHLRIHTGEKPFMCEVCGKGFLTRVDLKIHSTMHTGEKSYVCEMCGKAFARRDALRCHRRSHTGERPYSCDQCGQTFTQFSPMAIHKRLHTGERPYSCEVCAKTFVSRSTMMSHFKKHVR